MILINKKGEKNNKSLIVYKSSLIIILIILFRNIINIKYSPTKKNDNKYCFLPYNSNKTMIHIIITRFMLETFKLNGFDKIIYTKEYIENGIRVMKKYLFPSLEYQSCKDFIWILNIGDKANITHLKLLLNFKRNFKSVIIFNKDMKNFIKNITKNIDILITTRIDYDDRIYYDAVNDVRKVVNLSKPIFLYGYDRGFIYYEKYNIYTEFFKKWNNEGAMSIFESLIILIKKINDVYTIYDIGDHRKIRKKILVNYKKYGLKKLDYEPAIFETNAPKFVWVRQSYSGSFKYNGKPNGKAVYFDLNEFYGINK